jgi:hypothetical protein
LQANEHLVVQGNKINLGSKNITGRHNPHPNEAAARRAQSNWLKLD